MINNRNIQKWTTVRFCFFSLSMLYLICLVLQPLNGRAKLKIAKTAQEQEFEQPVLDAQFDFDEIDLNINKNQVWIIE